MTIPKRLRAIVKAAEQHGWSYDETRSGNPRLTPPKGMLDPRFPVDEDDPSSNVLAPAVTFTRTGAARDRGDTNGIAVLRRMGVKIK